MNAFPGKTMTRREYGAKHVNEGLSAGGGIGTSGGLGCWPRAERRAAGPDTGDARF